MELSGKKQDPYVTLRLHRGEASLGTEFRSATVKRGGRDPEWDTEMGPQAAIGHFAVRDGHPGEEGVCVGGGGGRRYWAGWGLVGLMWALCVLGP
jgi:hypothetical protein